MFTKPRAIAARRILFGLALTVFGPPEGAMALGLAWANRAAYRPLLVGRS